MNRKTLKQIYVTVPSKTFEEMLKYGLIDKSLDAWFISMVLDEIENRKQDNRNDKQSNR